MTDQAVQNDDDKVMRHFGARSKLTSVMGHPIEDQDWKYLEDEGHVERVESGDKDINWLAERLYRLYQRFSERKEPRESKSAQDKAMSNYIAGILHARQKLVVALANRDREVCRFRDEVLGGKLLPADEAQRWINEQIERDGSQTAWLTVAIDQKDLDKVAVDGSLFRSATRIESAYVEGAKWRYLPYAIPGADWVRHAPVARGGTLDRLWHLSNDLVKRYEWRRQVYAVMFVLTGAVVPLSSYSADVKISKGVQKPTVTLTVDLSFPPSRIASIYRRIQAQYLESAPRKLSDKHISLAARMADWPRDMPWQKRMEEWNRGHRKWTYAQVSNFRRDSIKARERVLGLPWPDFESILHGNESETFAQMVQKVGPAAASALHDPVDDEDDTSGT